jgi:hypothetical protein
VSSTDEAAGPVLQLPPAAEHLPELARRLSIRTVYVDLDGTLLGPGGSLIAGPDGPVTDPVRAVVALARAGIDLVLSSGRTADTMREVARLVGARACIAELGGLIVYREAGTERLVRNFGAFAGPGTPYLAIERSGAAGFLLDEFAGRLEPHAPWAYLPREASMLFRGRVDEAEAVRSLDAAGYGWLDLRDNGIIPGGRRRFPHLDQDEVHAYHLVPAGVNKRSAVARDRAERGMAADACIAIGDSPTDLDVAPEVAAVFVVANGAPSVAGRDVANAYLLDRPWGLGFADAVSAFVGGRPDTDNG